MLRLSSTHARSGPNASTLDFILTLMLCAMALPFAIVVSIIGLPFGVLLLLAFGGPLLLLLAFRYFAFKVKIPLLYQGMRLLMALFGFYARRVLSSSLQTSPEMKALEMVVNFNRPKFIKHFDLAMFRHQLEGYRVVFYVPFAELRATVTITLMRGVRCVEAQLIKTIPEGTDNVVLLYLHGGGFVAGCPETFLGCVVPIAHNIPQCTSVVFIDYRKAPEYPLPAAVDDATNVYEEMQARRAKGTQYVLMGDSAGGALVILTLLRLSKMTGLPQPKCGVAFSPYVDLTTSSDSWTRNCGKDFILEPRIIELAHGFSERVVKKGTDPKLYSPAHMTREELADLPPLYVSASLHEPVIDEILDFVARAKSAGVRMELEARPYMPHVYSTFWMWCPEGRQSIDAICKWIGTI